MRWGWTFISPIGPKGPKAQQMRLDMDLDGNGRLDAKEQLKLQRRLVAFATFELQLSREDTRSRRRWTNSG